jgi:hypothetical protein
MADGLPAAAHFFDLLLQPETWAFTSQTSRVQQ